MTLYDDQGNYIVGPVLQLSTKLGRQVPNEQRRPRPPAEMKAKKDIIMSSRRPSASNRSLSSVYNCMGLVFASRRTWIWPDYLDMILTDDEYNLVGSTREVRPGDVVVYRDQSGSVSHVGLVSDVHVNVAKATWDITVLSQWGEYGEYFHELDDVNPRLGEATEYWTDRI